MQNFQIAKPLLCLDIGIILFVYEDNSFAAGSAGHRMSKDSS
jgi:hypothetical protein